MRRIYDIVFWLAVAAGLYFGHGIFLHRVYPPVEQWIGPFAYVVFLLMGLLVFFVLNHLKEVIASSVTAMVSALTTGSPISFEGGRNERTLVRSARKFEKRGDYANAGEVYESLEAWLPAAEAYERAGLLSRAAAAMEKAGDRMQAISLYEREDSFEMAASLSAAEGLRDRANKNYTMAAEKAFDENRFVRAAELFERAHAFDRAGRVYETLQRPEDALRCYQRAGSGDKIIQMITQLKNDLSANAPTEKVELIRRCAELLVSQSRYSTAAVALEAVGDFVRGAEVYEKAEQWEQAGEAYLKAQVFERAEACYSRVSDPIKVADFHARAACARGDWQAAGNFFLEANKPLQAIEAFKRVRDFSSAGRAYEAMQRYQLAGEMYCSAKDFVAAGEAYAKGHDWRNAAECFQSAGVWLRAVEAFATGGDFYHAGVLALRNGDSAKAVEQLQRIPPTSPDHRMATGFLAAALFEQDRLQMAYELLNKVIDQIVPSTETLPIFYAYARLLELEDMDSAILAYHRILGVDLKYKDVAERVAQLQENGPTVSQLSARYMPTFDDLPSAPTIRTKSNTQTRFQTRRPMTQLPETRFGDEGRYMIIEELGRGGVAIVYKAFDQHLQREIALKTFPLSPRSGLNQEQLFLSQARVIARLSHPNIVTVYDCGHMDFLYYIAMEYAQGDNLREAVRKKGPLALEDARSILEQLADALIYAHSQQVLHLDVKPGNIILRHSGEIKVVDFGLAKILSEAAAKATANEDSQLTLVGTPQYMAPEQILGNAPDVRTDIYGLGLTLFYLLTGRTPFDARRISDPTEIARLQVHSSLPRPSTLRATLPEIVDEIFVKCTQKDPDDRYSDVRAFLEDISRL